MASEISRTVDAVIIGGGIQGCSIGLALARSGLSVAILEREQLGAHASGWHAGGVRQALRDTAEVPLSVMAMGLWEKIEGLVGDSCGFERRGHLEVFVDDAELSTASERVASLRKDGFDHEVILSAEDAKALVPALRADVVGTLYSERDGIADPMRTLQAFAGAAVRAGAFLTENCAVRNVQRIENAFRIDTSIGAFHAGIVVNAAGAWSGELALAFGDPAPMSAVAPMLAITDPMPPFLGPVVGLYGRPLSVKQWGDGTVMIGGGFRGDVDLPARIARVNERTLSHNHDLARQALPCLAGARIVRTWAAIEGAMEDDLPIIGASLTTPGLYHAFGFSAHGFQLAPAVGETLAQSILTGRVHPLLHALGPERFGAGKA
jgi:sarcosine oxidase, subunit beta